MDIRKPPAAHNAVRFISSSLQATARNVYKFQKGTPRLSYQRSYHAIHDRIHWAIDDATMLKMALRLKSEQNRDCNVEFLKAYLETEDHLRLAGVPAFDDQLVRFRISAGLQLPIKPVAIVADKDRFNVFTCLGWSATRLTPHQIRIWMTIHEDALFSLTDFKTARGVFALYPKNSGQRELQMWERGDFDLLSMRELDEELEMLSEAIQMADEWIKSERPSI